MDTPNSAINSGPPPAPAPDSAIAAGQPSAPATDTAITASPPLPKRPDAQLYRHVRLWPALLIVACQWLALYAGFRHFQGTMVQFIAMFLPTLATLLFSIWWVWGSRVPRMQSFAMLGLALAAAVVTLFVSHPTVGGFGLILHVLPVALTTWTVWLLASYALPWRVRYVGLAIVATCSIGFFTLVRMDGVRGSFFPIFSWRWRLTDVERFHADRASGKIALVPASNADTERVVLKPGDWPAFRGPNRDGKLTGVKIATDWDKNPPKLLWRHRVGPGWSSFTVIGKRLYTQEQNDLFESVMCYDSDTGNIIWEHLDEGHYTNEANIAGFGPRSTPTFYQGKIYSFGPTGILNCLDAASGIKQWSHDVKKIGEAKEPRWGYSSSPLIAQGNGIVFAGGPEGKAFLAFNAESGKLAWASGKADQLSYCSPQLVTLHGVEQVVITSNEGLLSLDPKTGASLWTFPWFSGDLVRATQPALVDGSDLLLETGFSAGTKRVHVSFEKEKWEAKEVWHTTAINPYYNDLVVHQGHGYGFDNGFFTCINLKNGKKKWRTRGEENGTGYGKGQVLLLADQDLLLLLTESGEVALVQADPSEYKELSRFKAIDGLTWNHPVVAHGRLFVRNKSEAACFQLTELGK